MVLPGCRIDGRCRADDSWTLEQWAVRWQIDRVSASTRGCGVEPGGGCGESGDFESGRRRQLDGDEHVHFRCGFRTTRAAADSEQFGEGASGKEKRVKIEDGDGGQVRVEDSDGKGEREWRRARRLQVQRSAQRPTREGSGSAGHWSVPVVAGPRAYRSNWDSEKKRGTTAATFSCAWLQAGGHLVLFPSLAPLTPSLPRKGPAAAPSSLPSSRPNSRRPFVRPYPRITDFLWLQLVGPPR